MILKIRCITFLLLLQIQKEVFYQKSLLKPLNKILEKYLRKSSFLVKLNVLKMNSFTCVFKVFTIRLSNLIHEFWEGCFLKPKLLLVLDRLIYLNVSIGTSKIHFPRPPGASQFFTQNTYSGLKIRPALKTIHDTYFMKQKTRPAYTCKNNYNL